MTENLCATLNIRGTMSRHGMVRNGIRVGVDTNEGLAGWQRVNKKHLLCVCMFVNVRAEAIRHNELDLKAKFRSRSTASLALCAYVTRTS